MLYPDHFLLKKSRRVQEVTGEIRTLLEDMSETMYAAPGIGLAAPQVGVDLRAIVIDVNENTDPASPRVLYKLLNPEIVGKSGSTDSEEGCLSIPEVRDTVKRAAEVVVEALDERGEPVTLEASGLLAVCLQHEIDHLDGVLFIDRLSRVRRELLKSKLQRLA
jgi:peptide deformylase